MANDGSKTSGTCAGCHRSSTKNCMGCLEAPVYDECVSKPTFYCGPTCQKADWSQHKSKCKELQARKTLNRAAIILQSIMYRIRLHASPYQYNSVRVKGSTVYLEGFTGGIGRMSKPLPCDRSPLEAALMYMACTEAMFYLHNFAREILFGLCSKIEEVSAAVTGQKLRISPVFKNGNRVNAAEFIFHNLYRVTLKNGEIWALDITGAQSGCLDPLCSWRDFEQIRSGKIQEVYELGYIHHQASKSHEISLLRFMMIQRIEKLDLTKALEEKIPEFSREYGGKLNAILRGSDAIFRQAKEKFLNQFEDHLRVSMINLYTLEQITRRNKEADRKFSQNMAYPGRQKELDNMMRFMASTMGVITGS